MIQSQTEIHPADTQQLIFVPQSTSSPLRTTWTDLYRRGPSSIFGTATKYSHLRQQYDEPANSNNNDIVLRNDSLLMDDIERRLWMEDSGDIELHRQHGILWTNNDNVHQQQQQVLDTTVLSISVEDLRLVETTMRFRSFRRHGSLDEVFWRKKEVPSKLDSPPSAKMKKRKNFPTSSEPKMSRKMVLEVDDLVLYSMSKEDIIRSWQKSERKLLNKLRDAVREKRALERKLVFIQKTLVKPP